MPTNRNSIPSTLVPGIHEIVGLSYGETPEQHLPLFEVYDSDRAFEEEVFMSGMGGAAVKPEGEAVQFDDIQETYTSRYNMETVAMAFGVSMEAIEDDLYDTITKAKSVELGRGMADTKQVKAASIFNNGFNSSFAGGDGVSLFNSAHPTLTGSFSNTSSVDLSESAMEDVCIEIENFTNDRGVLIVARPKSIHVPAALQFTAHKILKSNMSTGQGIYGVDAKTVNDTNALKNMGVFPDGMYVNHRFTDPAAWFVRTTVPNGTKMFVRSPLKGSDDVVFINDVAMFKFTERYAFGWTDPRGWFGCQGS